MVIPSGGGAAAWMAAVTIARRVQPPSQPPPAGGRRRVPVPSGVQGRTEHMSVEGLYGVEMRWLALTPGPSPARGRGVTRAARWGVPMRQKPR